MLLLFRLQLFQLVGQLQQFFVVGNDLFACQQRLDALDLTVEPLDLLFRLFQPGTALALFTLALLVEEILVFFFFLLPCSLGLSCFLLFGTGALQVLIVVAEIFLHAG